MAQGCDDTAIMVSTHSCTPLAPRTRGGGEDTGIITPPVYGGQGGYKNE
jgi:hypothetical protein